MQGKIGRSGCQGPVPVVPPAKSESLAALPNLTPQARFALLIVIALASRAVIVKHYLCPCARPAHVEKKL